MKSNRGLFSPSLRYTVPVDYTISIGTALANYVFVNICAGELVNLFLIHDADSEAHEISHAPSWLPTGYIAPFEGIIDMTRHANIKFSAQPSAGTLKIYMPYLAISDVRPGADCFSSKLRWSHSNTLASPKDAHGHALPFMAAVGIELLGAWNRNFHSWGPLTKSSEQNAIRDARDSAMLRENEISRQKIQVAANQQRAVLATFGVRKLTDKSVSRRDVWLWLVLCTEDGGKSWRREAICVLQESWTVNRNGANLLFAEMTKTCIKATCQCLGIHENKSIELNQHKN